MENTPPPTRTLRHRHTPTPKMSERKKALFVVTNHNHQTRSLNLPATIDEDSDLGPMSPLQFSRSPSSCGRSSPFVRTTRSTRSNAAATAAKAPLPTDFRNIMEQLSPCRKASDHYVAIETTPTKRRAASPPAPIVQPTVTTTCDLLLEKENCAVLQRIAQKTPTTSVADGRHTNSSTVPRAVHRKSLIFDTGLSPEDDCDNNAVAAAAIASHFVGHTPLRNVQHSANIAASAETTSRARASLTFGTPVERQAPCISARSFYGSAANVSSNFVSAAQKKTAAVVAAAAAAAAAAARTPARRVQSRRSAPAAPSAARNRGQISPPAAHSHSASRRMGRPPKPRPPMLGRGIVDRGHNGSKISKPMLTAMATTTTTTTTCGAKGGGRKFNSRAEVVAAALALIESHAKVTTVIRSNKARAPLDDKAAAAEADTQITQAQIEKLQRILRNQRNPYELAGRPLNWTGSGGGGGAAPLETTLSSDMDNTFGHISMLDTTLNNTAVDSAPKSLPAPPAAVPSELAPATALKRKFFKSDATNKTTHQYTVMKGMCASVQRGVGVQLLSPPKKRPKHSQAEYAELHAIRQEVTDIISMLEDSITTPDSEPSTAVAADTSTAIVAAVDVSASSAAAAASASTDDHIDATAQLIVQDEMMSKANYQRFARLLPYKTSDAATHQRQETLLNLLFTNNICTEQTFRIFIAEPEQHEAQATQILDQLFQVDVIGSQPVPVSAQHPQHEEQQQLDMETTMEPLRMYADEADDDISTLTSAMGLGSPTSKNFPIFRKSNVATQRATKTTGAVGVAPRKLIDWKAYGRDARQLQIDAGQKRFGGVQCECGMFYARHEPEDEALHQRYHDIAGRLQFKGWAEERIVCTVPEWGAGGRVVCVTQSDGWAKRSRAAEIVRIVDETLGVAADEALGEKSMIYLAIARRQVVGVCVAEPLQRAHPMCGAQAAGSVPLMDLTRTVPVRCGLSRMWVIEAYRRHGIGRRLFAAVCASFVRGEYTLRGQEVAFGGLTEAGCLFAARMVGESGQVLVY